MKLLRVRIENFRFLEKVEFEFSTDKDRNVTVIRAANDSGKTTLLYALQWGLFGDEALPSSRDFRLSPLDASTGERKAVTISVEIDYEVQVRTDIKRYRLIRSVTETVTGGTWERNAANVNLFHLTPKGADKILSAEAHMRPHLPKDLREIFFTDGDRALNFIEGSTGDQMERVEGAIRSLLGLGVIENALGDTLKVSKALNKRIRKNVGKQHELEEVSEKLAILMEGLPKLEEQEKEEKEDLLRLKDLEREIDHKLSDALQKGSKEELDKQRKKAVQGKLSAEKDAVQAARDHANLFKSKTLGKQFLAKKFKIAKSILDGLRDQGKIPNQTIPVLEDRLRQPACICGEKLDPDESDGQKRRKHIQDLIDASRDSDEIQEKVTALYFSAQELLKPVENIRWADKYSDVFKRRQRASEQRRRYGEEESEIEVKLDKLPDVDIRQLRLTRDDYRRQSEDKQAEITRLDSRLGNMRLVLHHSIILG